MSRQPMTPTGEALPDLTGDWVYYVNPTQDAKEHGGFVPSIVERGKPGYWPLIGREGAAPWVWGATLAEAEAVADELNAKRGYSQAEACRVVLSSMGASRRQRQDAGHPRD